MESDLGKLFIGGISWDTDEDRLKEYFSSYGEVVEAVIMRDRSTGRARGFGFVVFSDPAVAEKVVMEKHMIDGRSVEAKKAVPRDDQHIQNRNTGGIHGSFGPGRTKKIFVGGLPSTITESDFKKYFDQFGIINDVVVMYDHNTQRPRGFGFITYDSEDAVDRVLHKTFHELNGKMVEVKRAVPKEQSPGASRSPLLGFNYGFSRVNTLLNNYAQAYNLSSLGGYGVRTGARFSPVTISRSGFSPTGNSNHGIGMNLDSAMSPTYGGNSNFSSNLGYERMLRPYFSGNTNRYSTPVGYGANNVRNDSVLSSTVRNLWGNGTLNNGGNPTIPANYLGSVNASFGVPLGNSGSSWSSSPIMQGANATGYTNGNHSFGSGNTGYGLRGGGGPGMYNGASASAPISSFVASSGGYEGSYGNLNRGGTIYADSTWRSASSELDGYGSFVYGLGNVTSDDAAKSSEDYIGSYSVTNRQTNRGIAA